MLAPERPILKGLSKFVKMDRVEKYGEYPISVKRSRSDFRAKCMFDDRKVN